MPQPLTLDAATVWAVIGLLHLALPAAVWTVLVGRHDRDSTLLWCAGSALGGAMMLLYAARGVLPDALAIVVAGALNDLGFALRWAALRRERQFPAHAPALALGVVTAAALPPLLGTFDPTLRMLGNVAIWLLASLAIWSEARLLARGRKSRSARMLGWAYATLALVLAVRLTALVFDWGAGRHALVLDIDTAMLMLGWLFAALWGNVGYVGFAVEMAERQARVRSLELAAATERRELAERQAAELKALSDERAELLRVISHEVRQPLHNAQAVLQGTTEALRGSARGAGIARALSVLREITGSLDNTLAVSTRLVDSGAAPLRDTDIGMLVDLVLGDLPEDGRERVRVEGDAATRTAAADLGLMRLALRNLLNNALAYATPGTPVTLRVTDSDEPLALVFEVADEGPGIAPGLLPRLFERGVRGRHDVHGQGLGLYIVRRAMQMQGGSAEVRSDKGGSTFTLMLPQGQEPA